MFCHNIVPVSEGLCDLMGERSGSLYIELLETYLTIGTGYNSWVMTMKINNV